MLGEEFLTSLGCIIAYFGHETMDPGKDRFNNLWGALKDTMVRFADIEDGSLDAIYELPDDGNPRTLIVRRAQDQEYVVLRGLWQILGTGYKHVLNSFIDFLKKGLVSDFFNREHIGVHERHSVKEALSIFRKDVLLFHYPSLLLLRRTLAPQTTATDVVSLLENCNSLESAIHVVLPGEHRCPELDLASDDSMILTLKMIDSAGFSVNDWQSARAEFNLEPYVFSESRDLFLKARQRTFAILKSSFVRKTRVRFDLAEVQQFLEVFARADPPDEILYQPYDARSTGRVLIRNLRDLLERASVDIQKHLDQRIAEWVKKGRETPSFAQRLDREIYEYQFQDDESRTQNATDTLREYESVIKQLSSSFGESIVNVLEDERIGVLTTGCWANRYALLRHIGQMLRKHSPKTAGKLAKASAFRYPLSGRDLRVKLGLDEAHVKKPTPVTKTLVGVPIPEDQIDTELMKGPHGTIGVALRGHVNESLDLAGMGKKPRENAKAHHTGSGGASPRKGRRSARPRGTDELVGCLGEAFVYELFSRKFCDHGFDHTCWKSENKHRYLGIEGSDLLGYDFEWIDIRGLMADPGQKCLIEVKSSSRKDEAFPISAPEWERAKQSHNNHDETYAIIRVVDVLAIPQISDVLIDPVQLEEDGKLIVQKFDGWVRPGRLID
jgi:hypothetical protein